MGLIISWAAVVLLATVIVLSHLQRRNTATERNTVSRPADTGFFSGYTVLDWGLLIAAICFLVGAIFGTLNALS